MIMFYRCTDKQESLCLNLFNSYNWDKKISHLRRAKIDGPARIAISHWDRAYVTEEDARKNNDHPSRPRSVIRRITTKQLRSYFWSLQAKNTLIYRLSNIVKLSQFVVLKIWEKEIVYLYVDIELRYTSASIVSRRIELIQILSTTYL